MDFEISYTSKEITPLGGMVFLSQMLKKIKFRELIDDHPDLPKSSSNGGYKSSTIIEGFITSIWCGANWIFDNFKFDNFTLDIDSSVMTRYGDQ